jgi:hypothetical protein
MTARRISWRRGPDSADQLRTRSDAPRSNLGGFNLFLDEARAANSLSA